MLAPAHLGELLHHQGADVELGPGEARPKGLQTVQGGDVGHREHLRQHPAVQLQGLALGVTVSVFLCQSRHRLPEGGNVLPADGKACGQHMAAVVFQQRGQLL